MQFIFIMRPLSFIYKVGVDPGIDHLLAMECFDEVHTGKNAC